MKYTFEQIRDKVAKEFSVAAVNKAIEHDPELKTSFTDRDCGIKASADIYQSYDGQTNQDDINKSIEKIGSRVEHVGKKTSAAKKFVKGLASNGYYGYMLLRKAIGNKLEHPSLHPWYAGRLADIPSLINPGGRIKLSEGNFVFSGEMVLSTSQIAIVGAGYEATKISGAIGSSEDYIHFNSGIGNILLSDFYVDGSSHTAYGGAGFGGACIGSTTTGNIDGVTLNRVKVYSSAGKIGCVQFENIATGTIDNLSLINCYLHTVSTGGYGFAKRKQGKHAIVSGNTIIQDNVAGFNACSLYAATQNVIVEGNVVSGNGHSTIALSPCYHSVVMGNTVYGPSVATEAAIEIEAALGHGTGTSYYVTVVGNAIRPVSGTGEYGIVCRKGDSTDPHHISIGNNIVEGFAKGVYVIDGDHISIADNVLYNNTANLTNDNGTNLTIVDNDGFNPVGNFTAPAVPVSTTAYTNAYGYPCMVSVYGGTVTVIAVDAVATGQTAGTFVVAPGETITITYSVVPTWVWYGL